MKLKVNQKNATVIYSLIQILYFCISSLMFSYASAYLLNRGFSNGEIGVLLGIVNICSALAQPMVAVAVEKMHWKLNNTLLVLYGIMAGLALVIAVFPLAGIVFWIVQILVMVIQNALQPSMNALYRGYHERGTKIQFGLARGLGSASYSTVSLVAGIIVQKITPGILPSMYMVPCVLMCIVLIIFHAPNIETETVMNVTPKEKKLLLRQYPHYYLFLAGIVCLAATHSFTETFLLQILQRIGGTSANLGVAIFISAMTELPAMFLYRRFSDKVGNRRLLCFAGWMWATKNFLIILAPNVYLIYAAELLQFVSYAIYVPAGIRYISHAIPKSEFLKGQALAGSAFTVGCLIASFLGGQLIERLGLNVAVWIMQIFSVAGVILFTYAMFDSLKKFPNVQQDADA